MAYLFTFQTQILWDVNIQELTQSTTTKVTRSTEKKTMPDTIIELFAQRIIAAINDYKHSSVNDVEISILL